MMLRTLAVALAVLALAAGCGGGEGDGGAAPERSATAHNAADVTFATEMIQHHAQALAMVDLTLGRELDPQVAALAEQVRTARAPEIETMADWLVEWGEPVPETVRDHAHAHGDGGETGHDVPGMLSPERMDALAAARGAGFERMFLEMMVEHHEGAIAMADTEVAEGRHLPAVELAERIARTQRQEIEQMEEMLG